MADKALIKGARDVYRAGMYDPAKYEPLKRRLYRAADAIGKGFEMDRRRIERQHLENARRQERLETQAHQRAIAASNANIQLSQNIGQMFKGFDDDVRGTIDPHLRDAHAIYGECNKKRLDDPQNTAHSKCMEFQTQRIQNLQKDGSTASSRHATPDWLDKISLSNKPERVILTEVSLATQRIADDGTFYYDIDPDGDGVTERVTEKQVIELINNTDNAGGKGQGAVGTYILTTMQNAEKNGDVPKDIARDIKWTMERLSPGNSKDEYKNWKILAYDFDPSMGDDINMKFLKSQEHRITQNEYNEEYAKGEDGIIGTADDRGVISPDLVGGERVILDKDTGKIINEQVIGNWVDDEAFAWGDDKKLKNQQAKWLTHGVGGGLKPWTDKYNTGDKSIYEGLSTAAKLKWNEKLETQGILRGGYVKGNKNITGRSKFSGNTPNAVSWAAAGSLHNPDGTTGGWYIHKSGEPNTINEGYTTDDDNSLPIIWDGDDLMLYRALGIHNPGQ